VLILNEAMPAGWTGIIMLGKKKSFFVFVLISSLCQLTSTQELSCAEYRAADIEEYVQKLYSNSADDRGSAGEKLSEMGPEAKAAVPRLTEIVQNDPVMSVRGEAAKALGNIGPAAEPACSALMQFLKNKDGGIERAYAATALGNIHAHPETAVPALSEIVAAAEDLPVVRELSARALGDFGAQAQAALPVLIQAIQKEKKELREAAIAALKNIPATPRDVPALTTMLADDITGARLAAAKSIVGAGSEAEGAIPALIKLLQDSNSDVKLASVQALAAMGKSSKSALPALKLIKDPSIKSEVDDAIA
jgi:HEAT repeat protein